MALEPVSHNFGKEPIGPILLLECPFSAGMFQIVLPVD
jgi:hypothetical protein